jgi:putative tryptophan/tyrosine transport system substrate-binding protein
MLALVACSTTPPDEPKTIAFLRAVPGGGNDTALLDELKRSGFHPDRSLEILGGDPNETHLDPDETKLTIEGWVDQGVDVIFAFSSRGALAARDAAPEVPVIFLVNDPVAVGLVQNEDAPEGNLTGVTFRVPADRTLALARRALPSATRVGLIYSSTDPAAQPHRQSVERAARSLDIELVQRSFADEAGIKPAVDGLLAAGADSVFISNSPTGILARIAIRDAVAGRVPIIANTTVVDFALLNLDPDTEELYRQLGRQGARILGGSSPSTVPVEDPRRYRLTLNQAVAADFDISFPPDLVREADTVIR